jgi:IclR family pca regulon transcriptional regulator
MVLKLETVGSFSRGLAVLRSFAGVRSLTITDVADRTGLTRAAARRFLYTLCGEGLARTDGKNFELTAAVLELGHAYLSGMSELETVRDILQDLTLEIGESASAATLDGHDIVYVARSPARHRIMTVGLAVGSRLPAHAASMGQALLAQMHHNELEAFLQTSQLRALTPRTLTTRAALKERLALVRTRGYAVVSEELEIGLRAIAVSIEGRPRNATLAINLSAQSARISEPEMIKTYLPRLMHAARRIQLSGG